VNFIQKAISRFLPSTITNPQYYNSVFGSMAEKSVIWMPENPEGYIKTGYFSNPDVYAAVQTIVNIATVAPLNLYKVKNESAVKKYKSLCQGIPDRENLKQRSAWKTKALEEVDSHKVLGRLHRPNEYQTLTEFLANIYGFRLTTGNAYIYKAMSQIGTPELMGMYLLPSQYMSIISGGIMEPVSKYKLHYQSADEAFDANQVIHNRSWSLDYSYPGSHLFGIAPLRAARRSVTMSNDGREAQTWMLKNMGSKGMLALDPDGLKQPPTEAQMQKIKDDYNVGNNGIEKAGKVGVSIGKFQWHQFGMSSIDLSIIESLRMSQEDICKVFGISPVLLGNMSNSTDNNFKHARVQAITNAVIPLLTSVRDSLNMGFLPEFKLDGSYLLDFDTTVFTELQEDREKQAGYLSKSWWLTPNEARIEMGYGELPDENMGKIYVPSSITPLDQANEITELPNTDY